MSVARDSRGGTLAPWPHVPPVDLVRKLHVYPRHVLWQDCRPRAISYPDELGEGQYRRLAGLGVVDDGEARMYSTFCSTTLANDL